MVECPTSEVSGQSRRTGRQQQLIATFGFAAASLVATSAVDLTSVPESYDHHQEHVIVDGVDDAPVSHPDPETGPTT